MTQAGEQRLRRAIRGPPRATFKDVANRTWDNGRCIVEVLSCGHTLSGDRLRALKPGKSERLCRECTTPRKSESFPAATKTIRERAMDK